MGELLRDGLEAIRERTARAGRDLLLAVRARGLMVAVDLQDSAGAPFTRRVHHELVRRGFLVARRPARNVLRIDPPLVIERREIEEFLRALEETLVDATR